jgi:hypothetical protein
MPVINEQQLVHQLKELSQTFAAESLKKPVDKDAFEYGLVCGTVQGIAKAEELILKLLRGEDQSERKRTTPAPARQPYTA